MSHSTDKSVIERSYRAAPGELWALWTTREGFTSWWGPQGFRVEVHELDARVGGALRYDMIAASPEVIASMKAAGEPTSHGVSARFSALVPEQHLVITNLIDFIPGVTAYETNIAVDFIPDGDHTRMVVSFDPLHTEEFSRMQRGGFTSQLTKLDGRFE